MRRLLPKKIDFYILTEILGPFFGGVLFFSFLFLMFQAVRISDSLIIHGAPGTVVLKMISLMLVSFLPSSLPIAFLIGVLVAFGRLSADSELVAMKANGISLHRLTRPSVFVALNLLILSLFLNLTWVPRAERALKGTMIRLTNTKAVSAIREGTFTSGFFDLLIYAEKVDNETNHLSKVFIYDERDKKNPVTVIAREGQIVPVKTHSELGSSAALKLFNGSIHSNRVSSGAYQKMDFKEYQLFLKVAAGKDTAANRPSFFSLSEILAKLEEEQKPKVIRGLKAELLRRLSVAIAPLLFVFIGIGFGTVRTRAVRSGAALITISIITPYWLLQAASTKLVNDAGFPPALMLSPALLLAIIAYRAYRSALW